ncbi:hypothetical protein [Methylocaldum sp. GT1TLB]|uniref:hypothetical protein n=1 Tax=Methylocaldum sp. GT1TLB TaxID=3438965 RepID=UPI003DA1B63B
MKKRNLTKAILTALLLASPLAMAESEYPAADFEPVVITQDADLIAKHAEAAKERAKTVQTMQAKQDSSNSTAVSADQPSSGAAAEKAENPLAENYPIGLIVLGLAGFIFWSSRQSGSNVQPVQHAPAPVSSGAAGETGVAKYMKTLSEPAKAAASETGVAKYLKNLPSAAKPAAAVTGVAKYLKNLEETAR